MLMSAKSLKINVPSRLQLKITFSGMKWEKLICLNSYSLS